MLRYLKSGSAAKRIWYLPFIYRLMKASAHTSYAIIERKKFWCILTNQVSFPHGLERNLRIWSVTNVVSNMICPNLTYNAVVRFHREQVFKQSFGGDKLGESVENRWVLRLQEFRYQCHMNGNLKYCRDQIVQHVFNRELILKNWNHMQFAESAIFLVP